MRKILGKQPLREDVENGEKSLLNIHRVLVYNSNPSFSKVFSFLLWKKITHASTLRNHFIYAPLTLFCHVAVPDFSGKV
jgi:hypothetical protein